jgi:Domain of unknown function (DUF2017)
VKRRIERDSAGGYRLRLPVEERDVLRDLPAQLRELLQTSDPSLRRLFPPAYDDAEADDEYGELVRADLLDRKLAALEVVEQTVDANHLTGEQLEAWLGALESLRLVLGTQLDVSEATYDQELDPGDPLAPALALYGYLSWLQEQAVEALAAGLP